MRRVIIMGSGGRDFHDFNVIHRDDPGTEVVAFTSTAVSAATGRTYPPSLAGPRYPAGIPIRPEEELVALIHERAVDEVVFACSDVPHDEVMHAASTVLAAGADFRLLGPRTTMLVSARPVVAVCAARTGAGKSQTTRHVAGIVRDAGLRVAIIRHPLPYGDLEAIRVQRFASLADVDAARPSVEEREEYEGAVQSGFVVYAGVDYGEVLARAEGEADVIVWDGGNSDLPFVVPDLHIVVVDPLRPGEELAYHPGEANLRMADVVVINKVDTARSDDVVRVRAGVLAINRRTSIIRAASPPVLEEGPTIAGRRVLVVEDGRTLTQGGMSFGAATVAARRAGVAQRVDPRPTAVGSIAETLRRCPHLGPVLPAIGYSPEQLRDLEATINATECDMVVSGTPIDLGRLVRSRHPIRRVTYDLREDGEPTLAEALAPLIARARAAHELTGVPERAPAYALGPR